MFRKVDRNGVYNLGCLLDDGSILELDAANQNDPEDWKIYPEKTTQVKGKVLKSFNDKQDGFWNFLITQDEEETVRFYIYHIDKLIEYTDQVKVSPTSEVVSVFAPSDVTAFIVRDGPVVDLY